MPDAKPLSFQVPAPAVRPGGTPDFSDVPISRAGEVRRPEMDTAPEDIRDLAYAIIRVLTNLAAIEDRYAVDVLNDILQQTPVESVPANGPNTTRPPLHPDQDRSRRRGLGPSLNRTRNLNESLN